jgi:hypothetical protein
MGRKDDQAEAAREVMDRALRRLNILEYLILLLALGLALLGGALVAWILHTAFGLPFRWGWAGASLLLFLVPGGSVYFRELGRTKAPTGEAPEDGADAARYRDFDPPTEPKDLNG